MISVCKLSKRDFWGMIPLNFIKKQNHGDGSIARMLTIMLTIMLIKEAVLILMASALITVKTAITAITVKIG